MRLENQLETLAERLTRLCSQLENAIQEDPEIPAEVIRYSNFIKNLRFLIKENSEVSPLTFRHVSIFENSLAEISTSLFKSYPPKRRLIEGHELTPYQESSYPGKEEKERVRGLNTKISYAELLLGKTILKSAPITINIDPSVTCNYRCKICHHVMSQKNKVRYLPEAVIDRLGGLFHRLLEVHISGGGETTLSPSLPLLCEKIAESGVKADILTNGSTLSKLKIPLSALNKIGISFDGDNERTFQAIRHGSSFKRILVRIKNFKASYPNIKMFFNVVVHKVNLDELEGILQIAAKLKISEVMLNSMINLYPHHKNMVLTKKDIPELNRVLERIRVIAHDNNIYLHVAIDLDDLPEESESLSKEQLLLMLEEFEAAEDPGSTPLLQAIEESQFALLALSDLYQHQKAGNASAEIRIDDFKMSIVELEVYLASLEEEIRTAENEKVGMPTCTVPWFRANIRSDGTVIPCGVLTQKLGCIETSGGFESVWNGQDYLSLREAHVKSKSEDPNQLQLPPACKGCTFIERKIFSEDVREYARSLGVEL